MSVLQRRIHPTWHFTLLCVGMVIGVFGAKIIPGEWGMVTLFVGGILGLIAIASQRQWLLGMALIGGILIGLTRGGAVGLELSKYEMLFGRQIEVSGKVRDDTDTNARGQKILKISDISIYGTSLPGVAWATTSDTRTIKRSDRVVITGKVSEGFGNFPITLYNAKIVSAGREVPGDVALELRDTIAEGVRLSIPEPAASLGIGYLLGQKSVLPRELEEALVVTGLTHIVVASGYNLTILVRVARRLFEKISKYLTALISGGMIAGFIAITGLSPSMSRAGLVAGLSLWAWYYGRKFHPITLLFFAMSVTLLVNPAYAWGDIGWALSFAAFAGVMLLAPILQAYFWGEHEPSFLGKLVVETIAAIITTMPITIAVFGQLSIIAIFANLVIVPFVPLAMLLVLIAGVGGVLWGESAAIFAVPAKAVLSIMTNIIEWCSQIPWAQLTLSISWEGVVTSYLLLFLIGWYMAKKSHVRLRDTSLVE